MTNELDLIIIALCVIMIVALCIIIPHIIDEGKRDKKIEESIKKFNKNK